MNGVYIPKKNTEYTRNQVSYIVQWVGYKNYYQHLASAFASGSTGQVTQVADFYEFLRWCRAMDLGLAQPGTLYPCQNTNVYHIVVQCSQMFANIKHSITVFNELLLDVCEDSSKCEKRLRLAGYFSYEHLLYDTHSRRS